MLNSVYGNFYSNQSISKDDFIKSFEASQSGKKSGSDNIFSGELSAEAIGYIFDGLDKNGDGIVDNLDFSNAIDTQESKEALNEEDINYLLSEFEKMEMGNYSPEENFLFKQTINRKEKLEEQTNKKIQEPQDKTIHSGIELQTNPIVQEPSNLFIEAPQEEKKNKNRLGLFSF